MASIEEARSSKPDIAVAIDTLTSAGFLLEGATRNPGYILFHSSRHDEFGSTQRYCFLVAEALLSEEAIAGAQIAANHNGETLVAIGNGDVTQIHIEWERFLNLFGGPILSFTPLDPEFLDDLSLLGHNQLPKHLSGRADDLFEIFVHSALEFVLGGRVVRYGQARRFEACPDGLAIPGSHFIALYDAKAYADGYEVTADTIRQFDSYIRQFNARYSAWYKLNSFVLVSGEFQHRDATLESRSRELLAKSGVPLAFLTTRTLGEIVTLLRKSPLLRRSIDWVHVFTFPLVDSNEVRRQIDAIAHDRLIKE